MTGFLVIFFLTQDSQAQEWWDKYFQDLETFHAQFVEETSKEVTKRGQVFFSRKHKCLRIQYAGCDQELWLYPSRIVHREGSLVNYLDTSHPFEFWFQGGLSRQYQVRPLARSPYWYLECTDPGRGTECVWKFTFSPLRLHQWLLFQIDHVVRVTLHDVRHNPPLSEDTFHFRDPRHN